jgi:hypothetical protein
LDFAKQIMAGVTSESDTIITAMTETVMFVLAVESDAVLDYANTETPITSSYLVKSRIDFFGDRDVFNIELVAGVEYTSDLTGADSGGGTLADPWLGLWACGMVETFTSLKTEMGAAVSTAKCFLRLRQRAPTI